MNLTKDYLNECFQYDDGKLLWKIRPISHFKTIRGANTFNAQQAGKEAGCNSETSDGMIYRKVRVNKKLYFVHRLIWVMHHGDIPKEMEVDHIDHDGLNNSLNNLRLVSSTGNKTNRTLVATNKSGCMGVYYHRKNQVWIAEIVKHNQRIGLGCYKSKKEAIRARKKAEKQLGFHKNHGQDKNASRSTNTT